MSGRRPVTVSTQLWEEWLCTGTAGTLVCEYVGQGSREFDLNRYTVLKGRGINEDVTLTFQTCIPNSGV